MQIAESLDIGGPAFFNNSVLNVGTNLKTFLTDYRRPVLKWISATTVDVENNTGTANETKYVFPDGEVRKVVEDTSSTHKYRRFIITATATFSSGTEDSGLRSGLSEADNTWYAIYAVKSLINPAAVILAGDTTLPLQANVATLNGRYGENGYLYLGLIRNGDNSTAAGNILSFSQNGNMTLFRNDLAGLNIENHVGTSLATTASATTLTYTYAAGTGAAEIPNNVVIGLITGSGNSDDGILCLGTSINSKRIFHHADAAAQNWSYTGFMPVVDGIIVGTMGTKPYDIVLAGFIDQALGVGANPFI